MFGNLSDRITASFNQLRGKGRLTEADVNATVTEIRRALLEADVALPVVRAFTSAVREKAVDADLLARVEGLGAGGVDRLLAHRCGEGAHHGQGDVSLQEGAADLGDRGVDAVSYTHLTLPTTPYV